MNSSPRSSSGSLWEAALINWTQENAPYGILTTDTKLCVETWNRWLETYSGLSREQVIARPLFELFPELLTRRIADHFEAALKGATTILSTALHGYLLPLESTVRESQFSHMQQTSRIAPLRLEKQICGTIVVIEDVTQREFQTANLRHQHERREVLSWALAHLLGASEPALAVRELFQKVAAHAHADIHLNYLLDPSGDRMRLHDAGGMSKEQEQEFATLGAGEGLCGGCAETRTPLVLARLHESPDARAAALKSLGIRAFACHPLIAGERLIGTLVFADRRRDEFEKDEIQFFSTISQYVAVALDRAINEAALRTAQQELKAHAQELEHKVNERTARLQETIGQLESFSYTLAHDLRAPIRFLRGYSEVPLEDYSSRIPEDARVYIEKMGRAATQMELLTHDLLQFSKISNQQLLFTNVDLDRLVQEILALDSSLADREVLTVQRPLHAVYANEALLRKCLSNLLDNALKFVAPGTSPRIRIRSEQRDYKASTRPSDFATSSAFNPPNAPPLSRFSESPSPLSSGCQPTAVASVRIWVEDKGIGIDPQFKQKVFGIFERLVGNAEYEGTGIGLAIVAKAMQRMGGTCGFESTKGEGSRFWLELPAGQSGCGQ